MANEKLICADDVRREILAEDPKLAYIVDRVKPVDAVPVTRCRDCDNTCEGNTGLICLMWGVGTSPNGWCYQAERKDNENRKAAD